LEIQGPLALNFVGILARISAILADAGVSLVAISTFNTDYFLVKEPELAAATDALRAGGYTVIDDAGR
jgi:hypothetical protein